MSEQSPDPATPAGPVAPDAQVPAAPVAPAAPAPAPKEPLPVADGPLDSGVVGHLAATIATPIVDDVSKLASEIEHEAQQVLEDTYTEVDRLEAEANKAIESITAHTTGLLHSDAITKRLEKKGREGNRQVQIHTSLTAG